MWRADLQLELCSSEQRSQHKAVQIVKQVTIASKACFTVCYSTIKKKKVWTFNGGLNKTDVLNDETEVKWL